MEAHGAIRVLVIAGKFAAPGSDAWLIDDLVEALIAEGAAVDVVVYDVADPRPRGVQQQATGARVFSVGPPKSSRRGAARLLRHLTTALRLHTAIRHFLSPDPYDLCLYFSPAFLSGGLPSKLRRQRRVKHLVFVLWDFFPIHHGEIGRIRNPALLRPLKSLERLSLARADTIAVMSPGNGEFLRRYHPGLASGIITVPPWGGNDVAEPPSIPKFSEFTVVFGGQLTAGRGVEILIDAAAQVQQSTDRVRFLIIGSGPDRDRLEALALGMQLGNLEFRDRVSRGEYLQLLQRVHVGIAVTVPQVSVPSYPSKIVDYFRMGVPAIACLEPSSDAGRIIESSGAGVFVETGDAIRLAESIESLLAEHEAGLLASRGRLARRFYEENLSAESAARALLAVCEALPTEAPPTLG